jgi:hypothetical protein
MPVFYHSQNGDLSDMMAANAQVLRFARKAFRSPPTNSVVETARGLEIYDTLSSTLTRILSLLGEVINMNSMPGNQMSAGRKQEHRTSTFSSLLNMTKSLDRFMMTLPNLSDLTPLQYEDIKENIQNIQSYNQMVREMIPVERGLFSDYIAIFNRVFLRLQGYLMNMDVNVEAISQPSVPEAGPLPPPPGAGPFGGPPDDDDMDLDDDDAPPNIRVVPPARFMDIPNPRETAFHHPRGAVPQPRETESHPAMGDFHFIPPTPEPPISSRLRSREGRSKEDEPAEKKMKNQPAAGGHKKKTAAHQEEVIEEKEAKKRKTEKPVIKNYPAVPDLTRLNRGPAEHRDVIPPPVPEAAPTGRPRVRKTKAKTEDTEQGKRRRYQAPPSTTPHIPYPPGFLPMEQTALPRRRRTRLPMINI